MNLILASASPRRAELLAQAGWLCQVRPVEIEERLETGVPVGEAVKALALRKAQACTTEHGLIIGADTVVVLGEEILGKPSSAEEAKAMLGALSGREHRVITGLGLVNTSTGEKWSEAVETLVKFRLLSEEMIGAYVRSGEPMDKAGAYGIQGKGALLVEGIHGCYSNVVGLPLACLAEMLQEAGYPGAYSFGSR